MEHLEVSFTHAYIPIIEPALLGVISVDRSDLFTCSSSSVFFFLLFFYVSRVRSIEAARPEPVTAAQLVEHLELPSCQFDV